MAGSKAAAAFETAPVDRDLDLVGIDAVAHPVAALLVLDDVHADPGGLVDRPGEPVDRTVGVGWMIGAASGAVKVMLIGSISRSQNGSVPSGAIGRRAAASGWLRQPASAS